MADLIPDIHAMLRAGLGVEDIAVKLNWPVDPIRQLVRRWQETGAIMAILGMKAGRAGVVAPAAALTETPSQKETGNG